MEDLKNMLLEEIPGASPEIHLAARCEYVSAGWAVWWLIDGEEQRQYEKIACTRDEANRYINEHIALLQDCGLDVPHMHFGEIFLKG